MPSIDFLLIAAVPLLMSLTVHEFSHARAAFAFGDPTAKAMGRMTLNPLVHLDILGTLALLFAGFGWAKPVPINPSNLKPRRLGNIMVSLAGPLSNLALAVIFATLLKLIAVFMPAGLEIPELYFMIIVYTIIINLMLCMFNLIPLYPLDGHHILREILPSRLQSAFMQWQLRFGTYGLLALIFIPRILSRATGREIDGPIGMVLNLLLKHIMPFLEAGK